MFLPPIDQCAPPQAKIALFRSLFRGREDVYPRRFESRITGKSGYQPACANEWLRDVCQKPKVKCPDCPHRRFLPITDDTIRWHLLGCDDHGRDFVMGVYAILADETCCFLAADFDGEGWQENALAYVQAGQEKQLPMALERSRSGQGGHAWLFFEEAIPAVLARQLGAHLLTEAMERRPDIDFASYDRFFPNQDTLPRGGFGSLIALPLQKKARLAGNSLFVDDHAQPVRDQWAFLSALHRVSRAQAETIVQRAEQTGRIVGVRAVPVDDDEAVAAPWSLPPSRRPLNPPIHEALPAYLEIVLGNEIFIDQSDLPAPLRNRLLRLAEFLDLPAECPGTIGA